MVLVCGPGSCETDCVELTERESAVCNLICKSDQPISFGKLKQSTNLHQEVVSRIVKRLIVHGVVKHTASGYACEWPTCGSDILKQ